MLLLGNVYEKARYFNENNIVEVKAFQIFKRQSY